MRLDYNGISDELVRRIVALVPAHPEILTMRSAFDLFEVPGFECKDLAPSLAQAAAALGKAQAQARRA